MKNDRASLVAWIAIPICLLIGLFFAFAVGGNSQGSIYTPSVIGPIALAFAIQWVAFVPAYLLRTEKFYDLVGGLTFISVAVLALFMAPERGVKELVLFCFVLVWATRLSLFLFIRVHRAKSDRRFEEIKRSVPRFLFAWTAQGLWVTFSLAPVLAVKASEGGGELGPFFWIGVIVWLTGFGIEVVADRQKSSFRKMPENRGAFIRQGLWSLSRHPNYFGEIMLWVGVSIITIPSLTGWQYLCLSSPVFIFILLRFISGIPMLEKSAEERWGDACSYQEYKKSTPLLFPRLPLR